MTDFVFVYIAETDRYIVTADEDQKVLTNVEVDGLSSIIDFENLPAVLTSDELAEGLENVYFDNDGQETNFEIFFNEHS